MKKLWAVLLCFVLLFAMTACGNSASAASSEKQDAENEGFTFGDGKSQQPDREIISMWSIVIGQSAM